MHVEIIKDHLSIKQGLTFDLPDFTVLTGANGSGKSQLLRALTTLEFSKVDELTAADIVHMSQDTFALRDEQPVDAATLSQERESAWANWQAMQPGLLKIAEHRKTLGEEYSSIEAELRQTRGSFVDYFRKRTGVDLAKTIAEDDGPAFMQVGVEKARQFAKILPCSPDLVTKQDFQVYWPPQQAVGALPMQLSARMWNYYVEMYKNDIVGYRAQSGLPNSTAHIARGDFENIFGPKPWDLMNAFIERIGGLQYRVNSPEGSDLFGTFKMRLISRSDPTLEIDFSSLSSGEKTMLALAGILYKNSAGGNFPRLVLLDEVDASLHPSMVKGLIQVIEEVLIPLGTKVVMVTHSPTTVALAPEISLYQMSSAGADRIRKIERAAAVELLTEGFATLEQGITIFNEAAEYKVSVITEGKNNALVAKALVYFGMEGEVGVLRGMDGATGKSQIGTIFDFFARVPHKSSQVVCLLDPEVEQKYPAEMGGTHWIVLPSNKENKYVDRGIENAFDPALLGQFLVARWNEKEGKEIFKFDPDKKSEFVEFICGRNSREDFSWFEPVAAQLRALIARATTP